MKLNKCRIRILSFEKNVPLHRAWAMYEYEAPEEFEHQVGCGILFINGWDPNPTGSTLEVAGTRAQSMGCSHCEELVDVSSLSPSENYDWICPECVQTKEIAVHPEFDGWHAITRDYPDPDPDASR